MKRVLICSLILLTMLCGGIVFVAVADRYNSAIVSDLKKATELYQDNKPDKALYYIERVEKKWDSYYHIVCYIMPSDFIQETTKDIRKLRTLLITESDDFLVECKAVLYSINIIYENEFPYLRTII